MTDGVRALAEKGGAFWLLDIIASYQQKCRRDPMLRDMQFWKLSVKGSSAVVECERDEGDVAIRQEVGYTDFPIQGETKIWVEVSYQPSSGNDSGMEKVYVAMLPSER